MVTYPKGFIGPLPPPQPTVQPTPQTSGGSLANTMTTPAPQGLDLLAPPPTPTQNTGQSNQFGLSQVMTALENQTVKNNTLMTQRNLLLKHLYDQPLTSDEMGQLDPTFLTAVQKNDRNQIDMSLRLISDEVAGRTGTLDKSVQFLTTAYTDQIKQAEEERQNAINNVLQFAQVYGSGAKAALTSLYGAEYVNALKDQGIDLDKFASMETLAQKNARNSGSGSGTLAGSHIIDSSTDNAVKALIASRPGDGNYGDAYNAVKAKYGEAVANRYDQVYKSFFNDGSTIDAAFNNAKLGSGTGGLVDAYGKPVKLTAAQQSTVSDWKTLNQLADQTLTLGDSIGFSGTGGGFQGSIAQFMAKTFGSGTQEEEQLRNLITNIKGTLAKARGGTSFTPNEQKLLDSYTPGIDDSPQVIKAKLASLKSFISTTLTNIYSSAGAVNTPTSSTSSSSSGGGKSYQDYLNAIK